MTAMRQVQEMTVEFVNALNAAAAAEIECTKLRRLLEEERKLVRRLKQENEDEAQMAKRKIEKMSHLLAEARKDVEYATTRADFADVLNEWVKVKRQLQEARELLQLLKPESEETRQDVLRQVDDKELELANALDAASIDESEYDELMTMLEEVRKLVLRLILEAQLAKRQLEEIGQELAGAQENSEYATTRADVAERECARLKRILEEEQKFVQRLGPEKDDEVQLAKTQVGEIDQELAFNARNDSELARKDADIAEVKRDLKKMEELVKLLELECQEIRGSARRKDEEKALQLANALNASAIAKSECAKHKRMLVEERKTVQRLILEKNDEAEVAKRQIGKVGQELANAREDAQYARKDADMAKNEWIKLKRELEVKEEFIKTLKLQILVPMTQVEEISLELEQAQREAEHARNDADNFKVCAICQINEKDTAFGCGHMACQECGKRLYKCPICRVEITR